MDNTFSSSSSAVGETEREDHGRRVAESSPSLSDGSHGEKGSGEEEERDGSPTHTASWTPAADEDDDEEAARPPVAVVSISFFFSSSSWWWGWWGAATAVVLRDGAPCKGEREGNVTDTSFSAAPTTVWESGVVYRSH